MLTHQAFLREQNKMTKGIKVTTNISNWWNCTRFDICRVSTILSNGGWVKMRSIYRKNRTKIHNKISMYFHASSIQWILDEMKIVLWLSWQISSVTCWCFREWPGVKTPSHSLKCNEDPIHRSVYTSPRSNGLRKEKYLSVYDLNQDIKTLDVLVEYEF